MLLSSKTYKKSKFNAKQFVKQNVGYFVLLCIVLISIAIGVFGFNALKTSVLDNGPAGKVAIPASVAAPLTNSDADCGKDCGHISIITEAESIYGAALSQLENKGKFPTSFAEIEGIDHIDKGWSLFKTHLLYTAINDKACKMINDPIPDSFKNKSGPQCYNSVKTGKKVFAYSTTTLPVKEVGFWEPKVLLMPHANSYQIIFQGKDELVEKCGATSVKLGNELTFHRSGQKLVKPKVISLCVPAFASESKDVKESFNFLTASGALKPYAQKIYQAHSGGRQVSLYFSAYQGTCNYSNKRETGFTVGLAEGTISSINTQSRCLMDSADAPKIKKLDTSFANL